MKILLANIGGSSGYTQVLKKLIDIEDPNNIPDTLVIQECGSLRKFNGLEPFFKESIQSPALRLHYSHGSNLLKSNFHKSLNICSTVFKVKHSTFGCVFAYRRHLNDQKMFFDEILKEAQKLPKDIRGICIAGDFNTTTNNQYLVDLMDKLQLTSRTNAKHKHRLNSKEYQIDHVLSNIDPKLINVTAHKSLETINITNPSLGHPHFLIELGPRLTRGQEKVIPITSWPKVIDLLDTTHPITINQSTRPGKKSHHIAKAIIDWTQLAINECTTTKRVKINRIFNSRNLTMPKHNPNPNNQIAWKNFYRATNYLREGKCKDTNQSISPTQFRNMLQEKLENMPKVKHKEVEEHIAKITKYSPWFNNNNVNLYTDIKEVTEILRELNKSGARDIGHQTTNQMKKMSKSSNFLKWIVYLWNTIVDDDEIPDILKQDKIIYIWKKKGLATDPKKYRPITLVTGLSKIIEALLNRRILKLIPNPSIAFQHAYTKNRSTTTALMALESLMSKNNYGCSAIILVDLKGAFETVSHTTMEKYLSVFNTKISKLITSYLSNRTARVLDDNFPRDKPKLNYLPNRSTPQGSKVSPTIFAYNSGLITKWFRDLCISPTDSKTFCDVIVYADDAAIYVTCKNIKQLTKLIPKIIDTYSKICNTYGADLEPSKTEILVTKPTQENIQSLPILNVNIKLDTVVKWLGYDISISKKNSLNVHVSTAKVCAIKNSIRLFQLYNKNIKDNRKFYLIYIKPIIDQWLIDPNIYKEVEQLDAQTLKMIALMPHTTSSKGIYDKLKVETIEYRQYHFAKNLEERNIIKPSLKPIRQLKSGKICINEPNTTLAQKLSRICVQKPPIKIQEDFNSKEFCIWRVMVKKVIASKIKHRNKKVTSSKIN